MNILDVINNIINNINNIKCSLSNIQKYVGTIDETSIDTITGRLDALEKKVAESNESIEEWNGVSVWTSEPSTTTKQTEEW